MSTREWAHPRSRGENDPKELPGVAGAGSSPLTRGKPDRAAGPGQVLGLIPAHVGKTLYLAGMSISVTAHPRSRGENPRQMSAARRAAGSSPLTRGKPEARSNAAERSRLIPAHAGKTTPDGGRGAASRAHPRSRGENNVVVRVAHNAQGSSPLTRGKHIDRTCRQRQVGLIPAHAGKTPTSPAGTPA